MTPNFQVFHKPKTDQDHIYNYETQEYTIKSIKPININSFELLPGYEPTEGGLKSFADDMITWRNEILSSKVLKNPFDYFDNSFTLQNGNTYYRTHSININAFLKRLITSSDVGGKKVELDNITLDEEQYYKKCNNGGLTYHNEGIYETITTYDKTNFYASLLGSQFFKFPIKEGKIYNINKIPTTPFIYGIYNVMVESNDRNFNKVFAFSKDNHYTHFSLNFVKYYN